MMVRLASVGTAEMSSKKPDGSDRLYACKQDHTESVKSEHYTHNFRYILRECNSLNVTDECAVTHKNYFAACVKKILLCMSFVYALSMHVFS